MFALKNSELNTLPFDELPHTPWFESHLTRHGAESSGMSAKHCPRCFCGNLGRIAHDCGGVNKSIATTSGIHHKYLYPNFPDIHLQSVESHAWEQGYNPTSGVSVPKDQSDLNWRTWRASEKWHDHEMVKKRWLCSLGSNTIDRVQSIAEMDMLSRKVCQRRGLSTYTTWCDL